ncbi:uncharacterized protein RCO7_10220 [Rhynchosporium graminicola]|uniref:DUF676 domain-containing protein n=1 Tax=Rhynchosporium graminicola TaxID=2792576 RepID=A0A1E1K3N2_9HELO|nr:uncharacterized protein RCO7_10220 [Rhynchosporium commune]
MSSFYTKFYGSQVGGKSTTPHSYTSSPLSLLKQDILSALQFYKYLPYIVFPLTPQLSGPLCELYPSWGNLYDIFLHSILIIMQLPFLLSVPFWLMFPLWSVVAGVVVFAIVNNAICAALNGTKTVVGSRAEFAEAKKEHEHEQWIFLNGVAVGRNWLQNNVDRLALTFGRPILGVHNRTNGIIFDVIQCLIQRNFTYATQDVRDCYAVVKSTLYQPHLTKVIFILHSQGGIEGGLIIDWLLQEVPQDLLAKLEVYTFGNAANHFNNPHLHLLSQHAALRHPNVPAITKTTASVRFHEPTGATPTQNKTHDISSSEFKGRSGTNGVLTPLTTTTQPSQLTAQPKPPAYRQISRQESTSGKTIRYIEHYAHTYDFVARWGVLYFTKNMSLGPTAPRFMGRVFEREGKGHQMNMHYLDGMFPLRPVDVRSTVTGGLKGGLGDSGFWGADEREGMNPFMDSILELGLGDQNQTDALSQTQIPSQNGGREIDISDDVTSSRETLTISYLGAHGTTIEENENEDETGVLVKDMSPLSPATIRRFGGISAQRLGKIVNGKKEEGEKIQFKVKNLSRLWLYVNGKSPRIDETDVGIARMSTI